MSAEADDLIHAIAARQHGVVTRAQLLEAGLTSRQVHSRLAARRLEPLHRGVYLPAALTGALRPLRAPEMAAVLACGPEAVLSHRSAARVWGLLTRAGRRPEVTIPAHARRQRPGIRIHRAGDLATTDRTVHNGVPVTTPARTLCDLSAVVGAAALARAIARAEREGLVVPDDVAALPARRAGHSGAPLLRAVAAVDADRPFTRSEAEERLLQLVRSAGLPPPATNVKVLGTEVDFLWPEARLVVEVDGFRYHSSRPAFESDRRRDVRLAGGGYRVARLSWRQIVDEPERTLVALARALTTR